MSIELIIGAAVVVLLISMFIRHRRENPSVDMNHKAPNVHNVQMKGKVGPATAAEKPSPVKAAPAKKATKKTTKKATKKAAVDLEAMSKADLLALAKEKGVKANASLKKAELIERLK